MINKKDEGVNRLLVLLAVASLMFGIAGIVDAVIIEGNPVSGYFVPVINSTALNGSSRSIYTNVTNVFIEGNLTVNGSSSVTASTVCIGSDCRTNWPSGGGFTYSDYFDQALNKTSNLEFNTVKAHTSAGLIVNASNGIPVVDFGAGNTNNTNFYGSVLIPTGQNLCVGGECRNTWPNTSGGGLLFTGTPQNGYVAPIFNSTHLNGSVRSLYVDDSGATFTGAFALRTALDRQSMLITDYGGGPDRIDFMLPNRSVSVLWGSQEWPSYYLDDFRIDADTITLRGNVTATPGNIISSDEICLSGDCRTTWPSGAGSGAPKTKFISVFSGALTDTNSPLVARAMFNTWYTVCTNVTGYSHYRYGFARAATNGAAGYIGYPRYASTSVTSLAVGNWNLVNSSDSGLSLTLANRPYTSAYYGFSLSDDYCFMMWGSGGDGVLDPQLRNAWIEFVDLS